MVRENCPSGRFLEKKEIENIHQASLHIISEIGVKIEDSKLRKTLQEMGCQEEGHRIKFSIDLIQEMLSTLKKEIQLVNGGASCSLKKGITLSHPTGGMPNILDYHTGKHRLAVLSDYIKAIQLMNKLDNIDLPCASLYINDIPAQINQIKQFEYLLRYSNKPFYGPGISSPEEARYIVELFNVYSEFAGRTYGGNYFGLVGISPESPLYYPKQITDTMKVIIGAGMPTVMLIAPIVGISAPMTVAGGLAQMNASMLAFATLAYIFNSQTPIIYGARLGFANMKKGFSIWGLPDVGIASACAVELANYYGFISDVYGLSCSSSTFDSQSGYEKSLNGLLPTLAGANMLSGLGGLSSLTLASYEQLVIDNEIFAMIKKVIKGVTVNKDTLAIDIIADAAGKGNYLAQEHTVRHLRNGETFFPDIGFDALLTDWVREDKRSIESKARGRVEDLLKGCNDDTNLPEALDLEITKIVHVAQDELVVK